jgi:Ca2+-binding RTX toxin-like protein
MSNANPGDTVVLKTDGTARVPTFGLMKGISLRPAPGYKPTVESKGSVSTIAMSPAEDGATVSIRGIRFHNVELLLEFDDGSGHQVVIAGNRFTNPGDDGIISYYGGTSSGTLAIRNNRIAVGGTGIDARVQGGPVTIGGNQIYGRGPHAIYGGILLYLAESPEFEGRVENNVVHHANEGISVKVFSPQVFDLMLLNNTVDGVGDDAGTAGAGVHLSAEDGAILSARFFNNVISNTKGSGIQVDSTGSVDVVGDRNDEYHVPGNAFDHSVGPLLHLKPGYVDPTARNFQLRPASALVNTGQTCIEYTSLPRGDAAQKFRVAGKSVDIGAYERGSTVSGSVPGLNVSGADTFADVITGTSGRDILCGLEGGDTLKGKGGPDLVFGGDGDDHLWGNGGPDRVVGELGADQVNVRDGVHGNDVAIGGAGLDTCLSDPGDARFGCP